jgi:protein-tyrosine kinase
MGKIFDALQKAAGAVETGISDRIHRQESSAPEEPQGDTANVIESLLLNPPTAGDATESQRPLQMLPLHELLVTAHHNGDRERAFAAEQYKMLRSQLLFPADRPAPRTIMVTSAIPGEGKSVVAANLAISIALGKQEYTLLVECDLRRPSLAGLFGLQNPRGLQDYLTEESELSQVLCKTAVDKLTLLPAGQAARNPYELLSSRRMMDLLEEVKNRYDDRFIILDSTPAQVAAETNVLSRFIDGVVLVIRAGKSSRKVIDETIKTIGKEKFLGVVFNGFEGQHTNRYYYKYYGGSRKKMFKLF